MNTFIICHRGALGDFVLTWPALQCLRDLLRGHCLLGVGRRDFMHLAKSFGLLDCFLDMDSGGMHHFFSGRFIPSGLGDPDGAVLWLADGSATAQLLQKNASLPVALIPPFPARRIHVALYHCEAVQNHFPIIVPRPLSPYHPCKAERSGLVLIHPGSGSPRKNLSPLFYRRLGAVLREDGLGEVAFLMGPVEREGNLDVAFPGDRIIEPADLMELVSVLSGASLYIGNDSGVSHLAGIIGTPTVTLYTTTDSAIWGVLGRSVVHIEAKDEDRALLSIRRHLKILLR